MTDPKEPSVLDDWTCQRGHTGNYHETERGWKRCRTCKNDGWRRWYERNKAKKQAKNEEYNKNNWERIKQLSYKRRDPVKQKARMAINNAVNAGKFTREPCFSQDCDNPKTDFHHTHGYDEDHWFTGIWLCRKHHAQLHKELRWQTN